VRPFFSAQTARKSSFFTASPFAVAAQMQPEAVDDEAIEQSPVIQTKLTMGASGDRFELEADSMADRVVQRMHAGAAAPSVQAKCADCLEEERLQRQAEDDEAPDELVQAKAEGAMDVPGSVQQSLEGGTGGGTTMHPALRDEMESAFEADFSGVRIHTGPSAEHLSRDLSAQAFTYGRDIFFSAGEFRPDTSDGRHLLAHELTHVVQQHHGLARIQRNGAPQKPFPPLEITATSFEEAAANFAQLLAQQNQKDPARIVVVNGPNVRVFDETGKGVADSKFFHLQAPVSLPVGVFRQLPNRWQLYPIVMRPDGGYSVGGTVQIKETIHFGKDIDDQAGFDKALKGVSLVYYVSPRSTAVPPEVEVPPPVPIENLPEFMKFEPKTKANLPPWPSATIPLTPQLATVNSTGTFKCMVDKNQGITRIDRVTNLMQPTAFRWEVLKLNEKLRVVSKKQATGWEAAAEGYRRRLRNLEADRETLAGDPKKQSLPESILRQAMAEQVTQSRTILAMAGQTVMTIINAITGGPNQLTTEDVQDVPFKEQGDYFVRCLATQIVPEDAKWRRATSVSGVMVSVYDIQDVARDALSSGAELAADVESSLKEVEAQIARLDAEITAGEGDLVIKRSERAYKALSIDYLKALAKAGNDPHDRKVAELAYKRSAIAFFNSSAYPSGDKYVDFKKASLEKLKKEQAAVDTDIRRMEGKLKERDSEITQVGYMPGVLVDELTGFRTPLGFAVGERQYIAADKLEVVIADVTTAKGRIFDGRGGGFQGAGRHDAWLDAMDDLRKNLNRGRGYLSYQPPGRYALWAGEMPNPMQLQLSAGAQVKEMVDDTAHVLTLAAIMAAPFTGGSSLAILAVLAPIQAASSLYNIVNRAAYADLELDTEAVFDFINLATLGFSKLASAGKFASKSVQIVATSSRVAIRLLNAGQMLLITFETFQAIMAEDDSNGDPREGRRKKLLKLLSLCEAAAIPIAEKLRTEAHMPAGGPGKPGGPRDKTLYFEEPTPVPAGKKKPTITEGGLVEPGTAPVEKGPPGAGDRVPTARTPDAVQLKGVPKRLQGKVAVIEGMGRDARVAYKRGADGLITDVQIQIGERASAADVSAHVAVAELMLRYSGLGGKLRRLVDHFTNLFSGPEGKRPEVGSRAWEAKLELTKLDRMMRERHAELAQIADQPADKRDPARQAELLNDLDVLESQFNEHAAVFNAIELATAEGRGYVAAEGLIEGERVRKERKLPEAPDGYQWRYRKGQLEIRVIEEGKPKLLFDEKRFNENKYPFVEDTGARVVERFEPGIDRHKAFRELGGYDPKSSFGNFVKLLLEQGLIGSREDVIKAMGEPGGRTYDTVRGNTKEVFRQRLVEQITSPAYLKKTSRYREVYRATKDAAQAHRAAGMDELLRISERLGPEERGSLGERVYGELFGTEKGVTHVDISPAELAAAKGVAKSEVETGRSIDRMDGTAGREIKNVSSRLGPRERGQIEDMLAMVGSKVQPTSGPPRKLERVAVAFLDPVGGAANATLAHEFLSSNPDAPLTFEFHTRDGRILKVTSKNMDILLQADFPAKLGLPSKE
jgi:hypothetical protein